MHLADAVNVIAVTDRNELVLVRQFRAGSAHDSLETPGGLIDAGEDPLVAGARELLEETGYAGDPPELLGTVWSNPSILTSRTWIVAIANARRAAEPRLDHNEEVTVEVVPAAAISQMIRNGEIDHALVVCSLLWWLQAPPSA
jgi:8-oxo-dGTP pyrophosphatase MutT (NUDIX family)